MAYRYTPPDGDGTPETDGGEARPRPHKARRLVEVMDDTPRGDRGRVGQTSPPASDRPGADRPGENRPGSDRPVQSPFPETKQQPPARRASYALRRTVAPPPPSEPPAAPDGYTVLSVTPEGEGETVAVVLSTPAFEVGRITGGKDSPESAEPVRLKLHLLVEQYTDLKPTVGEITPEQAEALTEAGRLCAAIRRGMSLLGYGDPSARRLAYKLTVKGVDRETASAAVAYLVDKGYIREDNAATLRAEQSFRKGWGPRRIREDLRAQGFSAETAEEAMASLLEVDWVEACAEVIRKKYGEIPEDRGARQKLIATVMRLGYDTDTVREAMRVILRELS